MEEPALSLNRLMLISKAAKRDTSGRLDSVGDGRLRPWCSHGGGKVNQTTLSDTDCCRHLVNGMKHMRHLWFWPIRSVIWKH